MHYSEQAEPQAARVFDADTDSSAAPARLRANRRSLFFAGLGFAVYLLALVATIPAGILIPLPDASGTIWRGAAFLAGGNRVEWRWAPLRSLIGLGFAADFTVTGVDTMLGGRALLRPGGRVMLDSVSGSADGALLATLANPSFACAVRMQIDIREMSLGGGDRGADGRIRAQPGVCQAFGGAAPVAVPALTLDLDRTPGVTMINLVPRGGVRTPFLVGGLEEGGRLRLIVTAEGAAALPFLSPPGGMKVETEL